LGPAQNTEPGELLLAFIELRHKVIVQFASESCSDGAAYGWLML
jgi:hypothetical protein